METLVQGRCGSPDPHKIGWSETPSTHDLHNIGFSHAHWLPGLYSGIYYEFLSYVHPISEGAIGAHIIWSHSSEARGMDKYGQETREWITWSTSVKLSYVRKLNEELSVGIGAKYIHDNLFPCVGDEYMSVEEQVVPGHLMEVCFTNQIKFGNLDYHSKIWIRI